MSAPVLEIRSSPHVRSGKSVDSIMFNVVMALLPTAAFSVYLFGLQAMAVLAVSTASCVITEHLLCRLGDKRTTVGDWSAVITGLLLGLTLPPALPLWMVAVGGLVSIGIGKLLFGGLGFNCFNPALVGRAILQAAFPAAMTTWMVALPPDRFTSLVSSSLTPPLTRPEILPDAVSGATPLSQWKFDSTAAEVSDLAIGLTSGSAGETCAILIALGGLWLVARGMMNWRIPAAILATVAAFSAVLHAVDPARYASPEFMLLSGGLVLGAVFMASDMVGSPMTNLGCAVYGVLIGALVVVIRTWGGMPEGVMYAILLGNAATPHIDGWLQPRVFGDRKGELP